MGNNILKVKAIIEKIDKVKYGREGDAGIDLRASGRWIINLDEERKEIQQDEYEIKPGERILIKTGVIIALPKGCYGSIRDRSGLSGKHGLHLLAGVLDETYRGEIDLVIVNLGTKPYKLTKNEKVGQLIVCEYKIMNIEYVGELDDTIRGADGFGSSGRH